MLYRQKFSFVSLEIFAASQEQYEKFVAAGASGLTIYQETYHRSTYSVVHPQGPKKNFEWRINCPDRVLNAGFRKIGLGSLLGLYDWRYEASLLGLHAEYLMKKFWRSELAISFPRMCDMGQDFKVQHPVNDRHLVQMILAMRLFIPQTGLVLSTRESPQLRDHLMGIGITQMSAGSKTNPGGYKMKADSTEQFSISDHRSLENMINVLKKRGFDPVLKDWANELKGLNYECNN